MVFELGPIKMKYKSLYLGLFSPAVLPFWSLILIFILFYFIFNFYKTHNSTYSPVDSEGWASTVMILTVSLSVVIGFVRFFFVSLEF